MRAVTGTARYWGPLIAGFVCLVTASFAGPIAAWLLIVLAFGLILDGATAMFERAGARAISRPIVSREALNR